MGTMAKVVFYKKENDKFKSMRSFVTLYDGSTSVCKKLCKLMDGFGEKTTDFNASMKNIVSAFTDYVEWDNRLSKNMSEKDVDFCYKIYFDKKGSLFSISKRGKPVCTKVDYNEFEKQVRKIMPEYGYDF